VLGAQHRRLGVFEAIGCIDDAGELIGLRRTPAGLAGSQHSIVGHAESLKNGDGSEPT
jgi:hypothetical protein